MATNITEFSYRCQPELPKCPLGMINLKVVDAIIQFAIDTAIFKYGFEYSILSTDVDTSDNDSVTLDLSTISGDPYAYKRPHAIETFKIDGAPFDVQWFELSTDVTDLENIRYGTRRYFSFPSSTTVKIFPLEEQAARIYLTIIFKPIKGITTIDDFILEDHNEAIEAYVKWALMSQANKPWSSPMAKDEWNKYAEKMGQAKIKIDQYRTRSSRMIQQKYAF